MHYDTILDRLHCAVQPTQDRLASADLLPAHLSHIGRRLSTILTTDGLDASRAEVDALFAEGVLDPISRLTALLVLAVSPTVRDFAEASRIANLQEYLALQLGGPALQERLACADRHRGVVAYEMGRNAVALDWFSRAFERERTPQNLGNVIVTLATLGDHDAARELIDTVRESFSHAFYVSLEQRLRAESWGANLVG